MIPEIDIERAKKTLDEKGAVFVDIRDPQSFRAAHIPWAINVDDRTLPAFLAAADKKRTLIVYCYHGHSSLGGAAYFIEEGFADVDSRSGGFEAWSGVHPSEKG